MEEGRYEGGWLRKGRSGKQSWESEGLYGVREKCMAVWKVMFEYIGFLSVGLVGIAFCLYVVWMKQNTDMRGVRDVRDYKDVKGGGTEMQRTRSREERGVAVDEPDVKDTCVVQ